MASNNQYIIDYCYPISNRSLVCVQMTTTSMSEPTSTGPSTKGRSPVPQMQDSHDEDEVR